VSAIDIRVIDGMEALEALERIPVDDSSRPIQDIRIKEIIMHANPLADQS
jgi:peptidyl-prolyl cis-trans isomerase-like 3